MSDKLTIALGLLVSALVLGSLVRVAALRNADAHVRATRMQSLRSWWILLGLFSLGLLGGRVGLVLMVGVASLLALREHHALVARGGKPTALSRIGYALAAIYFLGLYLGIASADLFIALLVMLALMAGVVIAAGETKDYLRVVSAHLLGMILYVFGLSHIVFLYDAHSASDLPVGAAGLCLYLIVLTESNDIAQALVGRRIGGRFLRKLVPKVSPGKTWEGFIGGAAITILLAIVLSPQLTGIGGRAGAALLPASMLEPLVHGATIALLGLLGDLNVSAMKRDVGVKDSGHLLPGMGGMADRLDSLTFTAPAFYYLTELL